MYQKYRPVWGPALTLDIRWKQRFQNFDRAVALLGEPIECGIETLSALEKEGMVQRFEFALELEWKTLKDWSMKAASSSP